jgi:hypothetical protein
MLEILSSLESFASVVLGVIFKHSLDTSSNYWHLEMPLCNATSSFTRTISNVEPYTSFSFIIVLLSLVSDFIVCCLCYLGT